MELQYDNTLSVVISKDSLSFNIQKENAAPSRPQIMDLSNGLTIDDFINKIHNLGVNPAKSLLNVGIMNQEIYLDSIDTDVSESYRKFTENTPTYQGHFVVHEDVSPLSLRAVYAIDDSLKNKLSDFIHVNFRHLLPLLILDSVQNNYHLENHIRAHVNGNELCILLFKETKLIFYKIFKFSYPEDFLYYVRFAAEHSEMDINDSKLILSGRIQNNGRIFSLLKTYVGKIEFTSNDETYVFTDLRLLSNENN